MEPRLGVSSAYTVVSLKSWQVMPSKDVVAVLDWVCDTVDDCELVIELDSVFEAVEETVLKTVEETVLESVLVCVLATVDVAVDDAVEL